ncbi:carbohydrate ABC transporter permease [Ruminococcaceae bacterium OttesenSCG-928-L11]|nr:carbohydrate ABC transporter permease [Ruminococcaceae bacterium OttesenSCG-928-L11]
MKSVSARRKGGFIHETGFDMVFDIVIILIAVLLSLLVLYPLIYVVSASFSNPLSITRGEVWLLPKQITLNAYQSIITNQDLLSGFKNTVVIAVLGTLINLVMTTCCAYPLSRKEMFGHNTITVFITFTMFFSAGMIPNYLLIRDLNLLDNTLALILPGSISVYNMLIMRNYFQNSIPEDLFGAAKIDGCNNIQTLVKVVLPLSKSIIAVMVIFYAVGHWNAYFDSLLYMSSKDKFPLQLVLRRLLLESQALQDDTGIGQHMAESSLAFVSIQYAVIVVSSLPVLILYPLLQKYFVQGVMIGAVKG